MRLVAYRLGICGGALGILAGAVQWAFGSDIPELSGDKLHPVQLGILTIALSALAMACAWALAVNPGAGRSRRLAWIAGIAVPAGVCFTTVGALWIAPGVLLIAAVAIFTTEWVRRPATGGHS